MKIAYVITRADAVGGATIHVRDLARAMLDHGHETVVLVGGRGPVTDQLAGAAIPFVSLEFLGRAVHPVRDARALAEVISALAGLRPDIVSTHTAKAGWIGRAACARLGVPSVHTPHGWPLGRRFPSARGVVFTAAERLASKWSRAIICVCEFERRLALEKRIARPGDLFVVHNAVRDTAPALRADPGRNPARLCSVARFEAPKDHATLLKALAALRSEAWDLDLAGDGPLEPAVRRLAVTLGIAERVHFLGYQPDPAVALAGAQIFVLSSRSEAFPRSVLEAMRAGLPVIAPDVGGVGEAVAHGVNGLLVEPGNPAALSAAVRELLAGEALRRRLGWQARLAFEQRFRVECMVEKTQAIYVTVLSKDFGASERPLR